jgi:glycine oxidase
MHIIVVGAGVIGAAIAERLAVRGADVTLLDMRAPGRGASQASAGILAPYTEAHQTSPLLDLGVRSLALYDDFVAGVAERSGRTVEYARTGTLEVAFDADESGRFHDSAGWLTERNIEHRVIDGNEARAFEPALSSAVVGGLFVAAHGFVSVRSLVAALVHSARFHGVVLETGVEAAEVVVSNQHVEVVAAPRRWHGDPVVVASGSWSPRVRISGAPTIPVRPVRGQLLRLRWRGADMPRRVVWSHDCYVVPSAEMSVLVGATVEDVGFDESSSVSGVRELLAGVSKLLPAASQASVDDIRVGLRPQADGLPVIGPLPGAPRITLATGHYRNGVLLAPVTAEIVANYVLDGVSDRAFDITTPARFAPGT